MRESTVKVDSLLRLRYPAGKIFNSEPQHRERREVSHNAYRHHDHEPSQAMRHVALRPVRHHIQHAQQCGCHYDHRNKQTCQETAPAGLWGKDILLTQLPIEQAGIQTGRKANRE